MVAKTVLAGNVCVKVLFKRTGAVVEAVTMR